MQTKATLGIIVNSNRYFAFVDKLAGAALAKGKQVRIHLVGSGCEFINTEACARLSRKARCTLCAASMEKMALRVAGGIPGGVSLVPPQALTRIVKACHRCVVF